MSENLNKNSKEDIKASRNKLDKLTKLVKGSGVRKDLVLPVSIRSSLQDFVLKAQRRKQTGENENASTMVPQGRSLIVLFIDPTGTGKTMAAEMIAAQLGLDLYRIDLSSVVSKYIGETEKNLQRILSRATDKEQVLLFDEADALFGKRSEVKDAHDRYANTDISYLLQALEGYKGIVLFACNKKQNIDEAFIRRMDYVQKFPRRV